MQNLELGVKFTPDRGQSLVIGGQAWAVGFSTYSLCFISRFWRFSQNWHATFFLGVSHLVQESTARQVVCFNLRCDHVS